jgi:hypothetical protein
VTAIGRDSLLRSLVAHHRWVSLESMQSAPAGSAFRPGRAYVLPDHRTWGAPGPESYWWRDGRTDTLYVHPTFWGPRLVVHGHGVVRAGYVYGVGDLNPRPFRYGNITLTRRGSEPWV